MWVSASKIDKLQRVLDHVSVTLDRLEKILMTMQEELDRMTVDVSQLTTVTASIIELVTRFVELIRVNAEAPAKIHEAADVIEARIADIVAAVEANTPVDPLPPPPVE